MSMTSILNNANSSSGSGGVAAAPRQGTISSSNPAPVASVPIAAVAKQRIKDIIDAIVYKVRKGRQDEKHNQLRRYLATHRDAVLQKYSSSEIGSIGSNQASRLPCLESTRDEDEEMIPMVALPGSDHPATILAPSTADASEKGKGKGKGRGKRKRGGASTSKISSTTAMVTTTLSAASSVSSINSLTRSNTTSQVNSITSNKKRRFLVRQRFHGQERSSTIPTNRLTDATVPWSANAVPLSCHHTTTAISTSTQSLSIESCYFPSVTVNNSNRKGNPFDSLLQTDTSISATGAAALTLEPPSYPMNITCIPMRRNYHTADQKILTYVPYLDDNQDRNCLKELFTLHDTTYRENLIDHGSVCQQADAQEEMDLILTQCLHHAGLAQIVQQHYHTELQNSGREYSLMEPLALPMMHIASSTMLEYLVRALASVMKVKRNRVQGAWDRWVKANNSSSSQNNQNKKNKGLVVNCDNNASSPWSPSSPKTTTALEEASLSVSHSKARVSDTKNAPATSPSTEDTIMEPVSKNEDSFDRLYMQAVDSYRKLYCRQCHVYDCNLHGLNDDKSTISFQMEHGMRLEYNGFWNQQPWVSSFCRPCNIPAKSCYDHASGSAQDPFEHMQTLLSDFQKSLCKRLFLIYEGDVVKVAFAMRANRKAVQAFVLGQKWTPAPYSKGKTEQIAKRNTRYFSVKNYKPRWYDEMKKAEIFPFFYPCTHDAPCSDDGCTCVSNRFFCTRACAWGMDSPNFFRGCECRGACVTVQCTCFASNRECDPDVCNCGTCSDPPDQPMIKQHCRNDNIMMRRHARVLIGRSNTASAGWGLFTRYALRKGDYVGEYIGEMISQEEAERRGQIDDARNRSYLFNLCSDYVVDASRLGNKCRFMNHSTEPNCEARIMFVKGEQRIGFFANQSIEPEKELFFDYRYSLQLSNDLIEKAAVKVDWMEPRDSSKLTNANKERDNKDKDISRESVASSCNMSVESNQSGSETIAVSIEPTNSIAAALSMPSRKAGVTNSTRDAAAAPNASTGVSHRSNNTSSRTTTGASTKAPPGGNKKPVPTTTTTDGTPTTLGRANNDYHRSRAASHKTWQWWEQQDQE